MEEQYSAEWKKELMKISFRDLVHIFYDLKHEKGELKKDFIERIEEHLITKNK